jgi:adenylate cyclase
MLTRKMAGEQRIQRKLAAIVAADVVGYSRLMELDEAGTHSGMRSLRADVLEPNIKRFGGRIFKHTGDGAFAEFPSAVSATECAIEIQTTMSRGDIELHEKQQLSLRIGISLGDVIVDGDDIYGNGVNIAARMEALAEPGGICVSGNVYEHIESAIDMTFEDLGEQMVKNINRPIRSYQIKSAQMEPASAEAVSTTRKPIPLPEKPSVAVLPFQNMSGDPEQDFFSDGITDDIITELARYEELFVIARNSSFAYKGKGIDIRQIAAELGVATILEGSVRRAGDNIRIAAQLVEASSGSHIWAERYDRKLEDIFAVQDEITAMIVNTLVGKLARQHYKHASQKSPAEMDAYDHALRAMILFQRFNPSDNRKARAEAESAVAIDPQFARAHALVAWTHGVEGALRWGPDPKMSFGDALAAARKAISIDDQEPLAHAAAGYADIMGNHAFERGISEFERSVSLNPNNADLRSWYAIGLCFAGRPEDALREIELAIRLNPHFPPIYLNLHGRILFVLKRFDEALPVLERLVSAQPHNTSGLALTAACYSALGRDEEARMMIAKVLEVSPEYRLEVVHYSVPYARGEDLEFYCEMLRRSGLPE